MKKYLKISSILLVLAIILLGAKSYAEETLTTSAPNTPKAMKQQNRDDREKQREEFQNKIKEQREEGKTEIKDQKLEIKTEVQNLLNEVKQKREEYRKEFEGSKEEMKAKMAEVKASWKEELGKIKDEKKKLIADRVFNNINELNTLITGRLSEKADQIENVLVSIESRISKAKNNGTDVSSLDSYISKAKDAISSARDAIKTQSEKTYNTTLTDDTQLKTEMQALRDQFKTDIKVASEAVKSAHEAVKNTATELAKIKGMDSTVENASGTSSSN